MPNTAGIRLLAVKTHCHGMGVGKALTHFCIRQARRLDKRSVILHTTRAMQTAWTMYERIGFNRFPAIDFQQGELKVFGFKLELA